MRAQAAPAAPDPEALEFAARPNWLALMLAIVPALVVLQSLYVLVVKPVPIGLVLLILVTMGACGLVAAKAIESLMPTSVQLTEQGVDVNRTFGSQSFAWHDIEDIKLVPAPGTFADDPNRGLASRIGIGLFLKETAKDREDANVPDVVLFVGTDEDTSQLLGLMERIGRHRTRKAVPVRSGPPKIGARRPVAAKAQGQFRRNGETATG